MSDRSVRFGRKTSETAIEIELALDGEGRADVSTGVGFFDHMIRTLARHARFDLRLRCEGDLEVDEHHTVEDCALVLGSAIDRALEERRGIARFGWAFAPMDEALARAAVDLSGRPAAVVDLALRTERIGVCGATTLAHAIGSLAVGARAAIHVDVLRGEDDHHRAEAAFKALALALAAAVARDGTDAVRSTKGVLG